MNMTFRSQLRGHTSKDLIPLIEQCEKLDIKTLSVLITIASSILSEKIGGLK